MALSDTDQGARSPLTVLLDLIPRAQACTRSIELNFLAVNLTHQLVPYAQAFLYSEAEGILAISAVSEIEPHSPFIIWLTRLFDHLRAHPHAGALEISALPDDLRAAYHEWLPPHFCVIPLKDAGALAGYFAVCRDRPFDQDEIARLTYWMAAWYHASRFQRIEERSMRHAVTNLFQRRRRRKAGGEASGPILNAPRPAWFGQGWHRRRSVWGGVALLALCFVPLHLTVLAPAEIVPSNPMIVRAPIDGVLATFFVDPNTSVTVGQKLFAYDNASLLSKLEVAKQALASAEAEYRQSATLSLTDTKSKTSLALLQAKIEEKTIEYQYLVGEYQKSIVTAQVPGTVIFDDPAELIGKPLMTGEKVLAIANDAEVEIQAWLALGDMIELRTGDAVTMYLNSSPFEPVAGHVRYVAFEPAQQPDGSVAYRVRAAIGDATRSPRLGLKGTAKLSGRVVPLIYWVFRKPLAVTRQTIGF